MGLGFGPYILGAIKEVVGYTSMFHVTVVVALLAFVAYYFLYGRYVDVYKRQVEDLPSLREETQSRFKPAAPKTPKKTEMPGPFRPKTAKKPTRRRPRSER